MTRQRAAETRQQIRREGIELEKKLRARRREAQRAERLSKRPRKTEGSESYWHAIRTAQARLGRPRVPRKDSRTVQKGQAFGRTVERYQSGSDTKRLFHFTKGWRGAA